MNIDVLLGLQWGDEGKGKIVDVLTPRYDIVARFQGGPNAGHTIEFDDKKFILHHIPSGIFYPDKTNVIGNGVIIDPFILNKEIKNLKAHGISIGSNLLISKKAHLIIPTHRLLDAVYETAKGKDKIGSTLKGIGPTYTDKVARIGVQAGMIFGKNFKDRCNILKDKHLRIIESYDFDYRNYKIDGLLFDEYETKWYEAVGDIKALSFIDSEYFINDSLKNDKKILAEGAQGTMLDLDFGTYPFVTSSNTLVSSVCSGLGVSPRKIGEVFGVFKAYCTRVGSGPFPTELMDETGQHLRDEGREFGSTTGRPRRCGWLDLIALNYAIMLNGVTQLFMTKTDVLNSFGTIRIGTGYNLGEKTLNRFTVESDLDECNPVYTDLAGWQTDLSAFACSCELPQKLQDYISFIEKNTHVPIRIVSVGPDRKQTILV
ncbi:MAG: adenylosuccinate synthase [Bacteroidales bacterium]|nr:adenylosuccinate synthase [Bacteroidales bacterium]